MSKSNLDDFPPLQGLSQRQLCELMGWDYRQFAQTAKERGLSTHAHMQQQTGWTLRLELYYPPVATANRTQSIEDFEGMYPFKK